MRFSDKKIFILFFTIFFAFIICEAMFRFYGYKPFSAHPIEDNIEWLPRIPIYKDSLLGLRLHSGKFIVKYDNKFSIELTNNHEGFRITSNNDSSKTENYLGRINLFGDSYVQGCGVNDYETFSWLLQNEYKNHIVNNYGTPNYGIANVFNLITNFMPEPKPGDVYIYYYTSDHDNRLLYRNMKLSDAMPQIKDSVGILTLNSSLSTLFYPFSYTGIWLNQYSAFINFLEDIYIGRLDYAKNMESKSNSIKAILHMSNFCKNKGAKFMVASIRNDESDRNILAELSSLGIETIDVSVDLADKYYNLNPFDDHPNAKAHHEYFIKTSNALLFLNN
jgi:hypothetical protein